ncbi:phage capsid protein [Pseudooceanicola sp. 200-1SW]|uniref:phage capsid protein n=1 Tax=Pseudooceanicola sp. 200-1SW TaxID=3425949 RepID=UPI003D7F9598
MSYRQNVEAHHRLNYQNNVRMVAQQMLNPLRNAVTVVPASGEAQDMADLVDKVDYQEGEDYSQRNPENPPKRIRRWLVRPTVIQSGQLITKEEKFDQSQDPTSVLVTTHTKAVERGVFDRILGVRKKSDGSYEVSGGGILGAVHEGKTPSSQKSLPVGNFVAVNQDEDAAAGLTLNKMRFATESMELEDFGMEADDEVYGLITPKQKTDLLKLAFETGKNLNPFDVEQIRNGKPGSLLGINWIFTNRLPKDSNGYRLVPLWTKANIVCGMWQDVEGDLFNDSSKRNLPQCLVDAYPAAGRIEDQGVRVIRCLEA